MKYKTELEGLLTADLYRQDPGPFAKVSISDKGEFAVLNTGDKQSRRKLSHHAKLFLRMGQATFTTGESWYEPEEEK